MLPRWLTGKESSCQCRRHRFDPWSGKIPHAAGQLSSCSTTTECVLHSLGATATELMCLQSVLHNKRSHRNEKPAHCNSRVASACQKSLCNNEDSAEPKINKII